MNLPHLLFTNTKIFLERRILKFNLPNDQICVIWYNCTVINDWYYCIHVCAVIDVIIGSFTLTAQHYGCKYGLRLLSRQSIVSFGYYTHNKKYYPYK